MGEWMDGCCGGKWNAFFYWTLDYNWRAAVGAAMAELFNGYNGTIFAYGQVRMSCGGHQ